MNKDEILEEVVGTLDAYLDDARTQEGFITKQADGTWFWQPTDRGAEQQVQPVRFRLTIGVSVIS